jgi:hypothetical protein
VPTPAGMALIAVSCTSPVACSALATAISGARPKLLAERWNGTTWASQAIPAPRGTALVAVSCPSANSCTAVGYRLYRLPDGSSTSMGIAAHWDGTSWVVQATPPAPTAAYTLLFGVSCRPAAYCTAVGAQDTKKPLALHQ